MSWNEPENNKDKKNKGNDPWGQKDQAPPDLDEALKKIQNKLKRAFGGSGGGSGSFNNSDEDGSGAGLLAGFILIVALILWALSGIFIVSPAEQGVVLRFGKYLETVGPGPHWIPRFIDKKIIVNVSRVQQLSYAAHMLTKDENIVSVSVAVQYKVGDLKNYLFNVVDPEESLRQATASALRQVVGHTSLDQIITEGREVWAKNVQDLLVEILDGYKAGVVVASVSPQPARAPDQVQDAFDDAIKAQEDEKRFKEQAKAYREKVVPIAQGAAKRVIEEADAYAQKVVLNAKGTVAEFLALLPEYKLAPFVTRKRLYLDTMEKVLTKTTTILVSGNSNKLLYLPLDKIMAKQANNTSSDPAVKSQDSEASQSEPTVISQHSNSRLGRDTYRGRRVYQ